MDYFNTTYTHKKIGKVEKQMSQRLSYFFIEDDCVLNGEYNRKTSISLLSGFESVSLLLIRLDSFLT